MAFPFSHGVADCSCKTSVQPNIANKFVDQKGLWSSLHGPKDRVVDTRKKTTFFYLLFAYSGLFHAFE